MFMHVGVGWWNSYMLSIQDLGPEFRTPEPCKYQVAMEGLPVIPASGSTDRGSQSKFIEKPDIWESSGFD